MSRGRGCGCGTGSGTSSVQTPSSSIEVNSCGPAGCTQVTGCAPNIGCEAPVPGSPIPYYLQAPASQQSNCQTFVQQQFAAAIKATNQWSVPVCGGTVVLDVPNVTLIAVGSYLSAADIGTFEVVAFSPDTQKVTIQNNCADGNEAPGTVVPACTTLYVDGPPCDCSNGSQTGPFVAIDFTAPPVSTCLNITVTSVAGLVVSKDVQIGSGTYRVSAIVSNDIITICNDGDGIAPGTPVIAKNAAGDYQYPIVLIDVNACTNPTVITGALLVCHLGITQPLDAIEVGQVPVVVNATTNEVQFQSLDVPTRSCTTLNADLTLVNGTAAYTISVTDDSFMQVGSILQIGTRSDRLTVTGITDAHFFDATVDPVPSVTEVIPAGTAVCETFCCEQLQAQIDDIEAEIETFVSVVRPSTNTNLGDLALVVGVPQTTASNENFGGTITNPSLTRHMSVLSVVVGQTLINVASGTAGVEVTIETNINGGGFTTHAVEDFTTDDSLDPDGYAKRVSASSQLIDLAPGQTATILMRLSFVSFDGSPTVKSNFITGYLQGVLI